MASLYKKPVTIIDPRTGQKVKTTSKKWWGRFTDEHGREKRVPLATDKKAAQSLLHEYVVKVERKLAGLDDPFDAHKSRPLVAHLADFVTYLRNKGSTHDYWNTTKQRIDAVLRGCKFERVEQISASRVQAYLAQLRADGRSVASSNHYLRAIKMFTRWLVRDRRTNEDRLAHLSKLNIEVHRKRVRRPLSAAEFERLIRAAEAGPSIQKVTGRQRAMLYVMAAYTGLRRNEIGSLTGRSFDLDANPPVLIVEAGYSKHRRRDVIPLRKDFAEQIRTWLADRGPKHVDCPLFPVTDKRTSEMMKKDLARAGIPYIDESGRFADFHSLRMTFITNLCRAGVSPKTAQLLARHCDINLTMNTYTALGVLDQASAVEALPAVPNTNISGGLAAPLKIARTA